MMANDFLKILYQPNYIRVILFYIPTELNTSREGGPVDFEFSPGNDFDHFDYQGTTEKLYYDKIWQWKGIPAGPGLIAGNAGNAGNSGNHRFSSVLNFS